MRADELTRRLAELRIARRRDEELLKTALTGYRELTASIRMLLHPSMPGNTSIVPEINAHAAEAQLVQRYRGLAAEMANEFLFSEPDEPAVAVAEEVSDRAAAEP